MGMHRGVRIVVVTECFPFGLEGDHVAHRRPDHHAGPISLLGRESSRPLDSFPNGGHGELRCATDVSSLRSVAVLVEILHDTGAVHLAAGFPGKLQFGEAGPTLRETFMEGVDPNADRRHHTHTGDGDTAHGR